MHGLATRCSLTLLGSRASELADTVPGVWSRCLAPRGDEVDGGALRVALLAEGESPPEGVDVAGTDLDSVLQQLTQQVTTVNITAQTGRLFMFHAGGVADPDTGDALVYVARGGTGKTTLSRRLGERLGYLSDETIGFTPDGTIQAYPKPLSVRPVDYRGVKHELSPDALGLVATPGTARVRRLVLLDRWREPTEPAVTPLGLVPALVGLAPESSALSSLQRPLQTLAALLETLPPVVRLTYTEASEAADRLVDLLGEAR